MKLALPAQMRAIDAYTINNIGIPGMVLMENAALRVAEEAEKMLGSLQGRRIVLLAGKGSNGGDAFAAARHLVNRGACAAVYITAAIREITGDAAVFRGIAERLGIKLVELPQKGSRAGVPNFDSQIVFPESETQDLPSQNERLAELSKELEKADLVIDGIFGTGFRGEPRGLTGEVIRLVNSSEKRVLAIDIPSGLDGETGKIAGDCIKAERTVTFCLPKVGLIIHPGCEYTGKPVVADIGVPKEAVDSQGILLETIEAGRVSRAIPVRKDDSSKGNYGRLMIISGSTGMTGSGCLSARAALRTGAGLVYLGVPASLASIYGAAVQEPVVLPMEDKGTGRLSGKSAAGILEQLGKMDAAAIGPGLSTGEGVAGVVHAVVENAKIPLVIDADALNAIAMDKEILKSLKAPAVITPHPGEMARLMKVSIPEIQADRLGTARSFASQYGVIVVLKGSRTVIALPDGRTYVNINGNAGMATAGTGDVLTGVIASLIAQEAAPGDAAIAGVYLHGAAGDAAALHKGLHGLVAGDLPEELPGIIVKLQKTGDDSIGL